MALIIELFKVKIFSLMFLRDKEDINMKKFILSLDLGLAYLGHSD